MTTRTARRAGLVIVTVVSALIFAGFAAGYTAYHDTDYPTQQEQR